MTAKAHGMDDECQLLLDACGMTEDQITLPTIGTPQPPPRIIVPTHQANWPVKAASHTFFEKALLGEVEGTDDAGAAPTNGLGEEDGLDGDAAPANGLRGDIDEDDAAAGWDMGDDINVEVESEFVNLEGGADAGAGGAVGGNSEADQWTRNSPLAADHVAGGSFDSAMALLHRQVGAVAFAPLRPRFLEIYAASRTFLPATAGLPPLVNYVRRTVDATDARQLLPALPRDLEALAATDLQAGYAAMKANRLDDGLRLFRRILHALLVNAVASQAQVAEAKKVIATAREYAVAMAVELERRATGEDTPEAVQRSLELAAYFTIPKLEVAHRQLALMAAVKLATKHKNYSSALSFANRVIANGGAAKLLEQVSHSPFPVPVAIHSKSGIPLAVHADGKQAKRVKAQCERNPVDQVAIEFDPFAEFDVCAASHTPLYGGVPSVACPFDGAKYHEKEKGTVCRVCQVCEIGAPTSGLRLWAPSV